jgi:Sulfotransferase family
MRDVEYLFVTGCARSGTSVMADLLRSSCHIAMGRERFAYRYLGDRYFPPNLFEKERFCRQLHERDSHHRTLDAYYADLYQRFDQCRYRGDKIPEIALDYAPLLNFYERPKVIYMLRNCFDVASSFKCRALTAKAEGRTDGWPQHRGSDAAVEEWGRSIYNTLKLQNKMELLFIIYERLFIDDRIIKKIFHFLGVPITKAVTVAHQNAMLLYQDLEEQRKNALTSLEKLYIMRNADFYTYRRALDIAERQSNA